MSIAYWMKLFLSVSKEINRYMGGGQYVSVGQNGSGRNTRTDSYI